MYIKDYGYGRSKRCKKISWPVIGLCVTLLGMSGVTARATAESFTESAEAEGPVKELSCITISNGDAETIDGGTSTESVEDITAPLISGEEDDTTLIVIDPGHGGEDTGCEREGVDEKTINLQISILLQDKLLERGYDVLMTREEDVEITLEERVNKANSANGDLYISIHQNACEPEEGKVSGMETWYNSTAGGAESKRLAGVLHNQLITYTEKNDRGIKEDETLYVIREADMPSCLIETGFLSDAGDRASLTDPGFQERIADAIAEGIHLYFNPKTMYLTFDDGPTGDNTEEILDILKERNIQATFFVIGENVRKHPEVAKRIVAEGHTIGIHCNWHDYGKLYSSVADYVADFEKAYQAVYEVTGVEAKLFRFPGGSINAYNKKVYKDIIAEMTAKGYIYFDWNASLEDTMSKGGCDKLLQNAKDSTLCRKRVIMLAHDTVDDTVLCLEDLIDQFPEYQMLPLTEEVEPIQF